MSTTTDVLTEKITWRIERDDGEVMESELDEPTARKHFEAYDASEYHLVRCVDWVVAEPIPLWEPTLRERIVQAWHDLRGD